MFELLQLVHEYFIIPTTVVVLIVWLSVLFIRRYRNPAKQLSQQLRLVIADLQSLQATVDNKQLKQHLDAQLITKPLLHLWQMYQNILHDVKSNIDGEQ